MKDPEELNSGEANPEEVHPAETDREATMRVFGEALELPAASRASHVQAAFHGRPELIQEVQSLLEHADGEGSKFLADPAPITTRAGAAREALRSMLSDPLSAGDIVGPYTVGERLGEGGMSVVYRATQAAPIAREVALKVLRPGMDSQALLKRFDSEKQILAVMDHPNIASVLDAGASANGRPYFAMEVVHGQQIDAFCHDRNLSTSERIELFLGACKGVGHAHMRGVIHRDLKPSNILVTDYGDEHVPTIIDFGIAKAMSVPLDDDRTQLGHPVGTPAYMSPGQWDSDPDLDVRADVYALGVVLYWLLTGMYPYRFENLDQDQRGDIRREVERTDPVRMSVRLEEVGDEVQSGFGARTARKRARTLRNQLDWIVLKAIAKDKKRRYNSVQALVDDLERYRAHLPIVARKPRAMERCIGFCRRNQLLSVACVALTVLLAGIVAGLSFGMAKAVRERARANEMAEAAVTSEAEATVRAEEFEKVADFQAQQLASLDARAMGGGILSSIVEAVDADERSSLSRLLGGVNFTGIALEVLESSIHQHSIDAIQEQFEGQPLLRARLLQTVASASLEQGLLDFALGPQEESLAIRREHAGGADPGTMGSISASAALFVARGDSASAERYFQEYYDLAMAAYGEQHEVTLDAQSRLGVFLASRGRFEEAEGFIRRGLEGRSRLLGAEHFDTLVSQNGLGYLLHLRGELDEAARLFEATLAARRRTLGGEHSSTLRSIANLGSTYRAQGRLADAVELHREAVSTSRAVLGDDHPSTLIAINLLSQVVRLQGDVAEAERLVLEVFEARRRLLGARHPRTLMVMNNLASIHRDLNRLDEAEVLGAEVVRLSALVLDPADWHLGVYRGGYALTLLRLGRYEGAEASMLDAHRVLEDALGEEHDRTVKVVKGLAGLYRAWDEAVPGNGYGARAKEWQERYQESVGGSDD